MLIRRRFLCNNHIRFVLFSSECKLYQLYIEIRITRELYLCLLKIYVVQLSIQVRTRYKKVIFV